MDNPPHKPKVLNYADAPKRRSEWVWFTVPPIWFGVAALFFAALYYVFDSKSIADFNSAFLSAAFVFFVPLSIGAILLIPILRLRGSLTSAILIALTLCITAEMFGLWVFYIKLKS